MDIENLVLSGGGAKGYVYIGVIKALEEHNIISKLKKIIGSSIGSFFSLIIVLGYSSSELISIFSKANLSFNNLIKFSFDNNDIDNILITLLYNYGLDDGEKFHNIIKIFIKNKVGNSEITFKELHDNKNIELTIVITNLTTNSTEYCNYINTPNMKVHLAIRASISIPFILSPVIINDNYYIDGGITNNLPINYLSESEIKKSLAVSLTCIQQNNVESLQSYFISIFKCYIEYLDINKLNKYKDNILVIEQICNSIEFDISSEKITNLINKGYTTTKNYLNK